MYPPDTKVLQPNLLPLKHFSSLKVPKKLLVKSECWLLAHPRRSVERKAVRLGQEKHHRLILFSPHSKSGKLLNKKEALDERDLTWKPSHIRHSRQRICLTLQTKNVEKKRDRWQKAPSMRKMFGQMWKITKNYWYWFQWRSGLKMCTSGTQHAVNAVKGQIK